MGFGDGFSWEGSSLFVVDQKGLKHLMYSMERGGACELLIWPSRVLKKADRIHDVETRSEESDVT